MEKIFGIDNLLIEIYENLIFSDQLRLAQVNSTFKRIFACFIVPVKYRKLKITKVILKQEFIASNEKDEDCTCVSQDEITNLIKFGSDYVDEFHAIGECQLDTVDFVLGHLQNLTCLYCEDLFLNEKRLLLIADNCSKLRELRLIDCHSLDEFKCALMIGQTVSISTLEKMMKLKSLEIKYKTIYPTTITMSLFCELITKVSLECLKLDVVLKPDVHGNRYERTIHHNLKELEIEMYCETLKCLERLGVFKTLLKLHLALTDDVTDSALHILSNACENLECLSFGSKADFATIKQLQIPPNLKELSFSRCYKLEDAPIKDALTKFKIVQFRCENDYIHRRRFLNDFTISPHIRVLDLEGISPLQFSSVYPDNITLMELHWYVDVLSDADNTERRECLKTCRNLETLVIHSGYVPLGFILELKHLKKLHILNSTEWSYMISLFKHPSLKELYINNVDLQELQKSPAPGFPSTITLVYIPLVVLQLDLEFWLNMLQQNLKMSISCHTVWYDKEFLRFLNIIVHHEKLPKVIKDFKMWGFNLNYNDLRDNLMSNVEQLKKMYNCSILKTIVLCR